MHVLPTVQLHPRSLGLYILVLYRLPGEYTALIGSLSWHTELFILVTNWSLPSLLPYFTSMVWSSRPDNSSHVLPWSTCDQGQAPNSTPYCTSSPRMEPQTFCTTITDLSTQWTYPCYIHIHSTFDIFTHIQIYHYILEEATVFFSVSITFSGHLHILYQYVLAGA